MFAQLWHVGRVTHPDNIGGAQPLSSSAIQAKGVKVFVDNGSDARGFVETVTPRAMTQADIDAVVGQFRRAARNAMEAGFDGIELHAANGYLINQFLDSESIPAPTAMAVRSKTGCASSKEVTEAVCDEIGPDRVGVRLAPLTTLNGTVDANPRRPIWPPRLLGQLGVVYLHVAEADWDDAP